MRFFDVRWVVWVGLALVGCAEQPRAVLQYHQTDDTLIAPAAIGAVLKQIPRSDVDVVCVHSARYLGDRSQSLGRWTVYAVHQLDDRVAENAALCDGPAALKGDRVIHLGYRNGIHDLMSLGSGGNARDGYDALLAKLNAGHAVADVMAEGCKWGWYGVELAHVGQGKFEVVKVDHATPVCVS